MYTASLFETCAKLAAYLICIGLALELSHKLYWHVNSQVLSIKGSCAVRSLLSTLIACVPLATALAITAAFVNLFDSKSLISLGLAYDADSLTYVAYGAGVALGCVAAMFLLALLLGYVQTRRSQLSEDCISCLPLFFGGLVDFFSAALFEEIIFRGYIFFILYREWGAFMAIVGSSVVFALAHGIKHPNMPRLFTFNALIFGLLVATCRYHTGTLWLPIGLHFGWNVVSGPIFGLPYSGRSYDRGVVVSEVSGPVWLTGGLYSLDAGLMGTLALVIAAAGLIAIAPVH